MLNFREILISDKNQIDNILKRSCYTGSDHAFGTMFIWKHVYKLQICIHDEILLRRYGDTKKKYGFPLGTNDIHSLKKTLDIIIKQSFNESDEFNMIGLTDHMIDILEKLFPNQFEFFHTRNSDDYVYLLDDLRFLKGKKYHSKRNHISKFNKTHDFLYQKLTPDTINECKLIFDQWMETDDISDNLNEESSALTLALDNFELLGFIGAIIRVSGAAVAFTIGEKINNDVFAVHFEKAIKQYADAYPVINNEFVKNELCSFKYINREEDLGIEGLRKAKLSYHPCLILNKYSAKLKGG